MIHVKGTSGFFSSPSVVVAISEGYVRGTRDDVTAKIMLK
jgi:hypothetical protein